MRITNRVINGGHEVPISKIISRYYKSKTNATLILPLVDRAYIYDNSIENETPRLICRMVDGTLFKQYSDTIPEWAKDLLK
ncbi:MAG: hypothetical protein MJZ10_12600 [Fibrobacter sp.]|nr:hypothetical protein [Fibrobacter sp.]